MEHTLYQKYQMATHGDTEHECRESQFKRFLCDNPFNVREDEEDEDDDEVTTERPPLPGTYHQHYYISSTLFAVGVIDILPHCVSSVYFFYDPEYSFLSPGTLGALHEIHFVNELHKINPQMEYYYLGFYIHSCVKMRYKAKCRPCQLVCPVTGEWAGLSDSGGRVPALLDSVNGGFIKLKAEDGNVSGENVADNDDAVEKVLILNNRRVYKYKDFLPIILNSQKQSRSSTTTTSSGSSSGGDLKRQRDLQEMLKSYANLVGPTVASNMLIYVSSSVK